MVSDKHAVKAFKFCLREALWASTTLVACPLTLPETRIDVYIPPLTCSCLRCLCLLSSSCVDAGLQSPFLIFSMRYLLFQRRCCILNAVTCCSIFVTPGLLLWISTTLRRKECELGMGLSHCVFTLVLSCQCSFVADCTCPWKSLRVNFLLFNYGLTFGEAGI